MPPSSSSFGERPSFPHGEPPRDTVPRGDIVPSEVPQSPLTGDIQDRAGNTVFPSGVDVEAQPLTPEQMRIQEAGKEYARTICSAMEPFLKGQEHLATAETGMQGVTTAALLVASFDQRELKIHTPPDDNGRSIEITYEAKKTKIGYVVDPKVNIYAQETVLSDDGRTEQNPRRPLSEGDLVILDTVLERTFPKDVMYMDVVLKKTREHIGEMLQPQLPAAPSDQQGNQSQ